MASGADFIRKVKEQVREVDPKEVHPLVQSPNGAVIVDVREQHEFEESHLPGAKHVPRGHLESRIEGAAKDRSARVVLYCASGNRSALAARTLEQELGYENVESMTGGITLWKDRGYEVEVPRRLTPEQRERYSRHLLVPEIGIEGQLGTRRSRSRSPSPSALMIRSLASLPSRAFKIRKATSRVAPRHGRGSLHFMK